MKRLLSLIVATLIFCSSAAAADKKAKPGKDPGGWADAKWGMTGPQLEKAFAGKIAKADGEKAKEGIEYVIENYSHRQDHV